MPSVVTHWSGRERPVCSRAWSRGPPPWWRTPWPDTPTGAAAGSAQTWRWTLSLQHWSVWSCRRHAVSDWLENCGWTETGGERMWSSSQRAHVNICHGGGGEERATCKTWWAAAKWVFCKSLPQRSWWSHRVHLWQRSLASTCRRIVRNPRLAEAFWKPKNEILLRASLYWQDGADWATVSSVCFVHSACKSFRAAKCFSWI